MEGAPSCRWGCGSRGEWTLIAGPVLPLSTPMQREGFISINCCPALPTNDTQKWQQWAACLWCVAGHGRRAVRDRVWRAGAKRKAEGLVLRRWHAVPTDSEPGSHKAAGKGSDRSSAGTHLSGAPPPTAPLCSAAPATTLASQPLWMAFRSCRTAAAMPACLACLHEAARQRPLGWAAAPPASLAGEQAARLCHASPAWSEAVRINLRFSI